MIEAIESFNADGTVNVEIVGGKRSVTVAPGTEVIPRYWTNSIHMSRPNYWVPAKTLRFYEVRDERGCVIMRYKRSEYDKALRRALREAKRSARR